MVSKLSLSTNITTVLIKYFFLNIICKNQKENNGN